MENEALILEPLQPLVMLAAKTDARFAALTVFVSQQFAIGSKRDRDALLDRFGLLDDAKKKCAQVAKLESAIAALNRENKSA